ncbi:hypothetical protein [Enterococcus sp. AZ109]|uniref:hypothetical protein n=1 Tax=Enterococcus sp. AZ109 TaxID=2774634 RepID=UPI003F1F196E
MPEKPIGNMEHAHDPEKLGLPKPVIVTFLDGEVVEGNLIAVHPKRMDIELSDKRVISVFKHAIKYFEHPEG